MFLELQGENILSNFYLTGKGGDFLGRGTLERSACLYADCSRVPLCIEVYDLSKKRTNAKKGLDELRK